MKKDSQWRKLVVFRMKRWWQQNGNQLAAIPVNANTRGEGWESRREYGIHPGTGLWVQCCYEILTLSKWSIELSFSEKGAAAVIVWAIESKSYDWYRNFMHDLSLFCSLCFHLANVFVYKLCMGEQFYQSLELRYLPVSTRFNWKVTDS